MITNKCSKRKQIKDSILKGASHVTHRSAKVVPQRVQTIDFDCNCQIKCSLTLNQLQKQEIFNRYNALPSHEQQYALLKSLVIPVFDKTRNRQKFEYFIESKSDTNEVNIKYNIYIDSLYKAF